MRDIFARQILQSTSSASTLAVLTGYSWLQDDVLNWLQPAIAAINQYACCKNTYFAEKKVKGSNGHVYPLPWGNSKNAQNPTRNFQICAKSHEGLPNMHKISWLTSNNAQNPTRNFQNIHNPMRNSQICTILRGTSKNEQNPTRNFQICTKSHEELPKMHKIPRGTSKNAQKSHEKLPNMHKIPWGTSKYAQNPTRIFQKCTKSHEDLQKMHKISWLTSNNAQNPTRIFRKCTKSQEELPKMHKIQRGTSKNAQNHRRNF